MATDLTGALKEAPIKDPKKAMIATQQGFKKKFDQTFLIRMVLRIRMHSW